MGLCDGVDAIWHSWVGPSPLVPTLTLSSIIPFVETSFIDTDDNGIDVFWWAHWTDGCCRNDDWETYTYWGYDEDTGQTTCERELNDGGGYIRLQKLLMDKFPDTHPEKLKAETCEYVTNNSETWGGDIGLRVPPGIKTLTYYNIDSCCINT